LVELTASYHEEGPARLGGTAVEHPGNVRVVHHGQRLAFCFEARDDITGVHAQLDDLEGDAAADRLFLVRDIHHPTAALPDFLAQLVTANAVAGLFEWAIGKR
jgi:hypothetical protein